MHVPRIQSLTMSRRKGQPALFRRLFLISLLVTDIMMLLGTTTKGLRLTYSALREQNIKVFIAAKINNFMKKKTILPLGTDAKESNFK